MTATNSIAIFGGSFDPIHNGHLHLISALISSQRFSKIIVVPAGDPWQKKTLASPQDRYAMVNQALHSLKVEVSDCEITRQGPSYAIDTAREISLKNSGSTLTWIIGSDALANLDTWKDIEELARIVEFLVIVRPGTEINHTNVGHGIRWNALEVGALDISSTQVRAAIESRNDFSQLVPSSVGQYIREKGLYGAA